MDIEKTMELILGHQARFDESMARLTAYQIEAEARQMRELAAQRQQQAEAHTEHIRERAQLSRAEIRRGIHMTIEEFRRERQRRLDMYQELTAAQRELSAAQKVTEEKLQRLIDSLQAKP